jgi:hypothetical protein
MHPHRDGSEMEVPSKDAKISEVLLWLKDRIGSFSVIDHWEGDRRAIGVAAKHNPKQLVYICYEGRSDDYSVELETAPPPDSEMPHATIGRFNGVLREELARIVAQHLTPHP